MQWFDDLWLKEGFATYMAARMQSELGDAREAWKTFYLRNKPVAYGTDATAGATPVWQSLLQHIGSAANRDLTTWGQQWILRPGMPIVEQQRSVRGGRIERLLLVQRAAQPGISGAGGVAAETAGAAALQRRVGAGAGAGAVDR